MIEADDKAASNEREFDTVPEHPIATTRQRTDESRAERNRAVDSLRASLSDQEILTEFGIDLSQIAG